MPELLSKAYSQSEPESLERMQRLIFGRLALIFLLLLASWWWTASYLSGERSPVPTGLFLFFLVSISLTGIYHFVAYFYSNYPLQRRFQFFVDVLLVTWLVAETGDINSPYVSLYIVLICISGFMLGKAESLSLTAASALCFAGLALVKGDFEFASLSNSLPTSRFVQILGFNTVAILVVGLLAGRISERKRISEQLRESQESFEDLNLLHERIVESVDTGLITTDLAGKIYDFNRAAGAILGRTEADVAGHDVREMFGATLSRKIDSYLDEIRTDNLAVTHHFETSLENGAGEEVPVACSVSPLLRRAGDVSGLIVTFRDLSQMRALEESLRRADRLAAVGRMAAGLAHEIRNPLGSLSSSLQFLRERARSGSYESSLMDVVLRESERLNGIITNFLSYARPPAETLNKVSDPTDIDAMIRDCLMLMKHNPKVTDSHTFRYEPADSPMRSGMSETELKQIIWNLMQNSINAMPGGGDITVCVKRIPGRRIEMVVQDTGPGFTQANLDHLYEPFSRAAAGTGLGLSIVHKIVQENGGRINVDSVRGTGTRVVIELPGLA